MARPSKEQRSWLADKQEAGVLDGFENWSRNRNVSDLKAAANEYANIWESSLLNKPCTITTPINRKEIFDAIRAKIPQVNRFGIHARHGFTADIQHKLIQVLELEGGANLKFKNCAIKEITCRERDNSSSSLTLIDSWVGSLKLGPKSLRYLEIRGGGINYLECPLPYEAGPFVGSVNIPFSSFLPIAQNAQAFRNMRHHLMAMQNQEAASVFHSAEMRTLFKEQGLIDKIFNLLYRFISDYGNSTVRPLIWFCLFLVLNFTVFFLTDGAALRASNDLVGWRDLLLEQSAFGVAMRAGTITLTQIFNPLGIFGIRNVLVAKSLGLAVGSAILCLLATTSLAFFFLALRRRFRLART